MYSTRKLKLFANDKPWFTGSLKAKQKAKEDAYKSGDRALYKKAKYEVQKGICGAKIEYKWKLENQFLANNTRAVRKGMQTTTGYKKCSTTSCNDPQLPDNLTEFYSHFDHQNTPVTASPPDPATPLPPPFIVEESAVKKLFRKQNSKNAVGPDNVSTSVLKHCADQLSPVFTDNSFLTRPFNVLNPPLFQNVHYYSSSKEAEGDIHEQLQSGGAYFCGDESI